MNALGTPGKSGIKLIERFPQVTIVYEHFCILSREELPTRFRSCNIPDYQR